MPNFLDSQNIAFMFKGMPSFINSCILVCFATCASVIRYTAHAFPIFAAFSKVGKLDKRAIRW